MRTPSLFKAMRIHRARTHGSVVFLDDLEKRKKGKINDRGYVHTFHTTGHAFLSRVFSCVCVHCECTAWMRRRSFSPCFQGPCCTSGCTLRNGDKCRDDNGCRDASFCDGRSPQCPPSINKPNKTICNEEYVCYMGVSVHASCTVLSCYTSFLSHPVNFQHPLRDTFATTTG